ncbi:MAG: hypothetical protein CL504_08530 [Actinobacteria bacterium]|nr:hypothetical protein [Actinomycetota bacterium]
MQTPTLEEIDAMYRIRETAIREARKRQMEFLYSTREKGPIPKLGPITAEMVIAQEGILRNLRRDYSSLDGSLHTLSEIFQQGKVVNTRRR